MSDRQRLAALPERLLAPFAGREADAHRTVPGVWSPAQVLQHVVLALEASAAGLEGRKDAPPMRRRPRLAILPLAQAVVFTTGWFPPGRKAPASAMPQEHPDLDDLRRRLPAAVGRIAAAADALLPARAGDLFLRHPVFGDLNVQEWMRFHVVHCEHHLRQIVRRIQA